MWITIFLQLLLISPVICQFSPGMRADISFGSGSDRFDISHVLRAMEKPNRGHSSEDYRRSASRSYIIQKPEDNLKERRYRSHARGDKDDYNDIFVGRRSLNEFVGDGFSMVGDMISGENGSIDNFERILDNFRNDRQRQRKENLVLEGRLRVAQKRRKLDSIVDELHGIKGNNRRSNKASYMNPEAEILFHNALIFDAKVQGIMQPRLF